MKIGDKTFLNLQEAVAWLLENNALPYQSTANYVGNTEIALSTLINPSPAKVRVGSIIFFADSKVSTVIGLTSNSFIVSDQYNDLVDDVVYVSNVAINASGHLIVTLSNGDTIDAGLIKQVASFSIDGSQHLIATYNDGSTNDLGAIFSGNITVSGNLTVTGGISGNAITGDSIIENMSGYSYVADSPSNCEIDPIYAGVVKNGNKLTFAFAFYITKRSTSYQGSVCGFNIPSAIGALLYPSSIGGNNYLAGGKISALDDIEGSTMLNYAIRKNNNTSISFNVYGLTALTVDTQYYCRIEATFLLSTNLAS